MKILIEKASDWRFSKEVTFDHIEDCICHLLASPDNSKKVNEFVVKKLSEYDYPYHAYDYDEEKIYNVGELDEKIYNVGELEYVIKIYDDYLE